MTTARAEILDGSDSPRTSGGAVAEAEAVDATQRLKRAEADVEALRARCDDLDYLVARAVVAKSRARPCRRSRAGPRTRSSRGSGRSRRSEVDGGVWSGGPLLRRVEITRRGVARGSRAAAAAACWWNASARRPADRAWRLVFFAKWSCHRGGVGGGGSSSDASVQASDSAQGAASRRGVGAPELPSVQTSSSSEATTAGRAGARLRRLLQDPREHGRRVLENSRRGLDVARDVPREFEDLNGTPFSSVRARARGPRAPHRLRRRVARARRALEIAVVAHAPPPVVRRVRAGAVGRGRARTVGARPPRAPARGSARVPPPRGPRRPAPERVRHLHSPRRRGSAAVVWTAASALARPARGTARPRAARAATARARRGTGVGGSGTGGAWARAAAARASLAYFSRSWGVDRVAMGAASRVTQLHSCRLYVQN